MKSNHENSLFEFYGLSAASQFKTHENTSV